MDWFDLPAIQAPQFKSINSLALSLLYGLNLTPEHDEETDARRD